MINLDLFVYVLEDSFLEIKESWLFVIGIGLLEVLFLRIESSRDAPLLMNCPSRLVYFLIAPLCYK